MHEASTYRSQSILQTKQLRSKKVPLGRQPRPFLAGISDVFSMLRWVRMLECVVVYHCCDRHACRQRSQAISCRLTWQEFCIHQGGGVSTNSSCYKTAVDWSVFQG
jgi:hypothetical protein